MEFGMHRGKTIGEILDKDPCAIKIYWIAEKRVKGFNLQGEVLEKFCEIFPDCPHVPC